MKLSVSMIILRVQWLVLGPAHGNVGGVARTSVFEVMFLVARYSAPPHDRSS